MELERIASDLYREFPRNAEKLSKEMERLSGLLEETGAALMMEIEKEKYRKDKDPDRIREYRRLYRSVRRELESVESCLQQFSEEQRILKEEKERGTREKIDYDASVQAFLLHAASRVRLSVFLSLPGLVLPCRGTILQVCSRML